jgi:hypothetical protein
MPTGFTTVSGTNVCDSTGTKLNGVITFTPVLNDLVSTGLGVGGGGTAGDEMVSATVTSGAFSISLADTSLTRPINIGYWVRMYTPAGKEIFGRTFSCIQPSGSTWSFDSAIPNLAPQVSVVQGATGLSAYELAVNNGFSGSESAWLTSLQGANGTNGTNGAAGSLMNVKSLTDSLLAIPPSLNLFNPNQIVVDHQVNADGTLGAESGVNASPLIYCAGATLAMSNIPYRADAGGYGSVCIYDANANLISTLPSSYFGGFPSGIQGSAVTYPLPGTQTYIRFSWIASQAAGAYGTTAYPGSNGMVFFASTGAALIMPGTYPVFGFETVADVNTKIAAALVTASSSASGAIERVLNATIPGGIGRNLFDPASNLPNMRQNSDGTTFASSGFYVQTIYCPGATSVITDVPLRVVSGSDSVCVFDSNGNFLADLSAAWVADGVTGGAYATPNIAHVLPGTQTYLKFAWPLNYLFGIDGWANSPQTASVYAGTSSAPPPTSLWTIQFQPFTGTLNVNVKTAQELGCTPAGAIGYGRDNTTILNAFLATATATNAVKLILDSGKITVSGLVISPYGNTTIEGCGSGSGIVVAGGEPVDAIRIGAYVAGTGNSEGAYNITPPARSAVNIVLRNFSVDPTGAINASANQPVTGAAAHSTYGCVIANASNVKIENVDFLQAPTYAVMITNCDHVKVTGCSFTSTGTIHDGVHIDGLCEKIGIENCDFATGDDAIALNAPEGYGGDISDVTVTNCRFLGSLTVMRIYTSVTTATLPTNNVHKVRRVVVSNCTGTTRQFCFDLGITDGVNPTTDVDQLVDLSVSNCSFSSPNGLAGLYTPIGSLRFTNVVYAPTGSAALFNGAVSSLARLELDGLIIRRDSFANSAPTSIVGMINGVLGTVVLRKIAVVDTPGTSYAPIGALVSTVIPIAVLDLDGIDMMQVTALVDSGYANVAVVRGAGVLATGASIPDSVMDNGWLYASSSDSGAVSLKVAGTAKRLTLV